MSDKKIWNVMVTGGAGYVGSSLVPQLLAEGHRVSVLDLYLYGDDVFKDYCDNDRLIEVKGDLRDPKAVAKALEGCDAVIHLACISNDPSFELNPDLGKSINHDAFLPLVEAAKKQGVKRFIYASSSSVYGIKDEDEVTEDLALEPLTDYSKYKAICEEELHQAAGDMTYVIIRPSTVCGYSPRLRLDLTVNILTNHAINKGKITVFGGEQKRPNIHIKDMVGLYCFLLQQEDAALNGKTFNAGYENFKVGEIANMVNEALGGNIAIEVTPTDDNRSYHVSSEKMRRELGFVPKHTILDAIRDLKAAFDAGKVPNSLEDERYFNIKLMQNKHLR